MSEEISQNASTIEKIIEEEIEAEWQKDMPYFKAISTNNIPQLMDDFARNVSLRVSKEASLRAYEEIEESIKTKEAKLEKEKESGNIVGDWSRGVNHGELMALYKLRKEIDLRRREIEQK